MPATLTRRHMEPLEQAGSRYAELMRLVLTMLKDPSKRPFLQNGGGGGCRKAMRSRET